MSIEQSTLEGLEYAPTNDESDDDCYLCEHTDLGCFAHFEP